MRKFISIACLILLIVSSSLALKYEIVKTSDEAFNDIMNKYNRKVGIAKYETGSYGLYGTCNRCSISPSEGCTTCTEMACLDSVVPNEYFVCQYLNNGNMKKLLALNKQDQDITLTSVKSGSMTWIKLKVVV